MNFYDKLPKPFLALAPMEGVTDIIFRQVVARAGRPDLFYTEFTNVDSYCSQAGRQDALKRLEFLPNEQPIVAQIWGTKPDNFYQTALGLKKLGYRAIDINMGCPDKVAIRTGGGAALIKTPDLANEIIVATKKAGLPVSAKTRLGYSRVDEWQDWLSNLLSQDLPLLTIHLRTKKEMSKVVAHYEVVPKIIELRDQIAPQTKIMINGDVTDRNLAKKLAQQYQVDGIMIGRGVFANPFCFTNHQPSQKELIDLLKLHLDLFDKANQNNTRKFDPLKRFFKIYINNFAGAKDLRAKLMETKSTAEVRQLLQELDHA